MESKLNNSELSSVQDFQKHHAKSKSIVGSEKDKKIINRSPCYTDRV